MTGKQRFETALRFEEGDRPPHFESVYQLEQETFGLSLPWGDYKNAKTRDERLSAIAKAMPIYEKIVERFKWDALAVWFPWGDPDAIVTAKKAFGDDIAVGGMVGGGLWAIEIIHDWVDFSTKLYEHRDQIHAEAEAMCVRACASIDAQAEAGADFFYLPHDVGFNGGCFISPEDFREIVTPYMRRMIDRVKHHGRWAIFHSDGQLMSILDQILECEPHCLHSIDSMAGMDIAEVKKLTHGKMALMGNVQCNLMQEGPDEAIRKSARYCLEHASAKGGYIFSTSNTIFPGMPLRNYEVMLDEFHRFNTEKTKRTTD